LEIEYNPEFLIKLERYIRKELQKAPIHVGL